MNDCGVLYSGTHYTSIEAASGKRNTAWSMRQAPHRLYSYERYQGKSRPSQSAQLETESLRTAQQCRPRKNTYSRSDHSAASCQCRSATASTENDARQPSSRRVCSTQTAWVTAVPNAIDVIAVLVTFPASEMHRSQNCPTRKLKRSRAL